MTDEENDLKIDDDPRDEETEALAFPCGQPLDDDDQLDEILVDLEADQRDAVDDPVDEDLEDELADLALEDDDDEEPPQ